MGGGGGVGFITENSAGRQVVVEELVRWLMGECEPVSCWRLLSF